MKKLTSDQWMGVGLGVMATGVIALAALDMGGARSPLLPAGTPMPEVSGVLAGGEEVRLAEGDSGGEVLLLDFWATWCPACVRSMPNLQRLESELGADGFRLLTINTDDARNRSEQGRLVRGFLADAGLDLPVLLDDGRLQHTFNAYTLPTIYLVGRDGKIVRGWSGSASHGELRRAIRAALEDESGDEP